jgi:preprotein translocase subunit YajC
LKDFCYATFRFFLQSAFAADTASTQSQGGGISLIIMTAVFILFMYFVMWRPQSRRAREHKDLINGLAKGDEVVTSGGILGRISKMTDNYIVLALTDNVEITIQKNSIVNALPKGTLKSIA